MWLDEVNFNDQGLVPVITQDMFTHEVVMLAWANREALEEAARTKRAVYYSRSRQCLWRKGEESANVQEIAEIRIDCDGDAVLYLVTQPTGITCHTGRSSCFFRTLDGTELRVTLPVLKDPEEMYGAKK